MSNSKKPIEKRLPMNEWNSQDKNNAIIALQIAKNQDKPIKYLLKS